MTTRSGILWLLKYYSSKALNIRVIDHRELYAHWEQQQLKRLFDLLRVDCVFDIGANEGQYARMLRRKVGYRGWIASFEPIPAAAERVRMHARSDPRWLVFETAISDVDGTRSFNVMGDTEFSSFASPVHNDVQMFVARNAVQQSIEVSSKTLESAYEEVFRATGFKRPFLKMDTQGFDLIIAEASSQNMRAFVGLQSELAIARLYDSANDFRETLTAYERMGFTLTAFVPNNAGHFPRLLEIDCIMTRTDLIPKHLRGS